MDILFVSNPATLVGFYYLGTKVHSSTLMVSGMRKECAMLPIQLIVIVPMVIIFGALTFLPFLGDPPRRKDP